MKTNKLLSLITPSQLKRDLKQLGSAVQIAKKYGISVCTVYSAFKIAGIDGFVRARNVDTLFTKEQLQQDYNELQSTRKIGEKYDISYETVREYIHKWKLEYNSLVKYGCDHQFFSQETEASFYLAGFIAADGCLRDRDNRHELYIGLSKHDKQHLQMIKELLKAEAPIHEFLVIPSENSIVKKPFWKAEITITSPQIFNNLKLFNITPRKTFTYKIPTWILNHPLGHHFLRGQFDGDGSFYTTLKKGRKTEQVYFNILGTKQVCEIYRQVIETNYPSVIKGHKITKKPGCYKLEYGGNGILAEIAQYLYHDATIYLPRKYYLIKHLL